MSEWEPSPEDILGDIPSRLEPCKDPVTPPPAPPPIPPVRNPPRILKIMGGELYEVCEAGVFLAHDDGHRRAVDWNKVLRERMESIINFR